MYFCVYIIRTLKFLFTIKINYLKCFESSFSVAGSLVTLKGGDILGIALISRQKEK